MQEEDYPGHPWEKIKMRAFLKTAGVILSYVLAGATCALAIAAAGWFIGMVFDLIDKIVAG